MEVESARCDYYGLKEDCTKEYISGVKADFNGKWLCGLCAQAVRDEVGKWRQKGYGGVEEAMDAYMSFCRKFKSNPTVQVANGMRQMLRRRLGEMSLASTALTKKFGRSEGTSQVGNDSSISLF